MFWHGFGMLLIYCRKRMWPGSPKPHEAQRPHRHIGMVLIWFGIILVWFWYGFGMVLICFDMVLVLFWYGFGMVLVWCW